MIWKHKDRETTIQTRFAVFPKLINGYFVWLQHYYVVYRFVYMDVYSDYIPHYFVEKSDAEYFINDYIKQLRKGNQQ